MTGPRRETNRGCAANAWSSRRLCVSCATGR
jgi:hypothetical protein